MTTILTATHDGTIVQSHQAAQAFKRWAIQMFTSLSIQSKPQDYTEEAAQVLHDEAASLDMREWAERYLCKMTMASAQQYCAGRLAQS